MGNPRFSIVVPTRQRHVTLEATLRTCLDQDCDSYEIVVCDNCSSSDTAAVVRGLDSNLIRYVRSDRPLAMSDNWELGVAQARGEYVTVLGDDDGLLPHALEHISGILRSNPAEALRWPQIHYKWPSAPGWNNPNRILIPEHGQAFVEQARATLAAVCRGRLRYPALPMIYNSFIHADVVKRVRDRAGRLFGDLCPDVFSGITHAMVLAEFVTLGVPLAIDGQSSGSNGVAHMRGRRSSSVAEEFEDLSEAAGLRWHAGVPKVGWGFRSITLEALLQASDALGAPLPGPLGPEDIVSQIVEDFVLDVEFAGKSWEGTLAAFAKTWPNRPDLIERASAERANLEGRGRGELHWPWDHLGWSQGRLLLDGRDFGVSDVHGVAQLYERIFHMRGRPSAPPIPRCPPPWWKPAKDTLHQLTPPLLWRLGKLALQRRPAN